MNALTRGVSIVATALGLLIPSAAKADGWYWGGASADLTESASLHTNNYWYNWGSENSGSANYSISNLSLTWNGSASASAFVHTTDEWEGVFGYGQTAATEQFVFAELTGNYDNEDDSTPESVSLDYNASISGSITNTAGWAENWLVPDESHGDTLLANVGAGAQVWGDLGGGVSGGAWGQGGTTNGPVSEQGPGGATSASGPNDTTHASGPNSGTSESGNEGGRWSGWGAHIEFSINVGDTYVYDSGDVGGINIEPSLYAFASADAFLMTTNSYWQRVSVGGRAAATIEGSITYTIVP